MFICYISDNRRDKDCNQGDCFKSTALRAAGGIHRSQWKKFTSFGGRAVFVYNPRVNLVRISRPVFPQTSYLPSRVSKVSAGAAAAARSEQSSLLAA